MISRSKVMGQLRTLAEAYGSNDTNYLISGQTGTGKKMLAKWIHDNSARKDKPIVMIDASALRETLLASEMFGHEKGSFTGAYARKIGLLEVSNGGTFIVDNADELPPSIQAQLVTFLKTGEAYRLGSTISYQANSRVVLISKRPLIYHVNNGTFRADLYRLIKGLPLEVPSLKDRLDDLDLLINDFMYNRVLAKEKHISLEAYEILREYEWPGNVRELHQVLERSCILSQSEMIRPADLPEALRVPLKSASDLEGYDPGVTVYELEKQYILKSLRYFEGNKTQAANALGITIKTLYNKLHEYGEFENFARGIK